MFVAAFVGSPAVNFSAGRAAQDGQSFVPLAGASIAVAPPPLAARNRPVVLGVRPEHIVIDAADGTPAEVAVVEPKGSETHVVVTLAAMPVTCVLRERVCLEIGQKVFVSCRGAKSHYFYPQTSLRVD